MIEAAKLTVVFVVWLGVVGGLVCVGFWQAAGSDGLARRVVGGGLVALGLALFAGPLIYAERQRDEQGPCFRYDTGHRFDPATKTSRPYRHCVERGEWTD